jgi:hypothetical protein
MPSPVTQSIGILGTQLVTPQVAAQGAAATEAAKLAGITAPQALAQAQQSAITVQNDRKRNVSPGRERVDGLFTGQRRPEAEDDAPADDTPDARTTLASERVKGGRLSTVG